MSSQIVPQGYKQTKVGVIPEDWEVVKLKDIVKVSQGLQISITNRFTEASSNRVFYITIPYTEGKKIEYIENASASVLCKKDDLLVVRTGSGAGNIITGVEGAFHNNFFKIKSFDNLDIKFLYFFLTSQKTKFIMRKYASNGTIPDLPHGDFYSINCSLPPLKEQQKIAEILTAWDDAISKQEELIRAKEELKKGLMQKLLSAEVRFNGFFDEWENIRLGEITNFYLGLTYTPTYVKEGISFLSVKDINGGKISFKSTKYISKEEFEKSTDNAKPKQGDIIFGRVGTLGNPIVIMDNKPFCIFVSLGIMRVNNRAENFFIKYWMNSIFFKKQVVSQVAGSSQKNLNVGWLKNFKLKLPSIPEQQKIAEVLSNADNEIDLLKNELEELKEQKKGLMQRLLTGEVRVNI